jgi:uncharacterized RDD family membrane protein YckC
MHVEIGPTRSLASEIYVRRNGERAGPFTLEEINRHLAAGALDLVDQAWSEGSPGWKPLSSIPGVIVPGGASSTAMPIGIATPANVVLHRYAGFWIRTVAFSIDAFILTFVAVAILFAFGRVGGSISIWGAFVIEAVCFLYMPVMWASPARATLGQGLCGLRVIRPGGGAISLPRGILRVLGMIVSAAIFGAGYVMIFSDAEKRGLHDMIAGTQVIRAD